MSSSLSFENKGKDILIFGKGPTRGLDGTTLTAEAKCPINSTKSNERFALNLHYNGNSFLFVNATKIYQFKAKNPEIKKCPLCLNNMSKESTIDNMKKQDYRNVQKNFLLITDLLILIKF